FACPEVFLGIFPAWGGTQLVPRLAGPARAVKLVVANPLRQNRMLTGAEAVELGLADVLLEPAEFVDESIAFARKLAEKPLAGPQAQAAIYAFGRVEQRTKRAPAEITEVTPRRVQKVGIVGAGLMARQIATLFLRRLEVPIVIRDLSYEVVEDALGDICGEIDRLVATGRYDEGKGRFLQSLVSGTTGYDEFAGCDLVLEAVFEELAVKKEVFAELERVVAPD